MALTTCEECGKQISKSAKTCPGCGAALPRRHSRTQWAIIGLATIGIVSCIASQQEANEKVATQEAAKSPAQLSAEALLKAAEEERFQRVLAGAKTLKSSSKNPASFQLASALLMPSGAVCYSYRATNSFNAVVPGNAALVKDKLLLSDADWNKHCGGKTGTEYGYVRRAL